MGKEDKMIAKLIKYLGKRKKHKKRKNRRKSSASRSRSPSVDRRSSSVQSTDTRSRSPVRSSRSPTNEEIKENAQNNVSKDQPEIQNTYLDALGIDYTQPEKFEGEIHDDLAKRFNHILVNGLTKEERETIMKKHTIPKNCTLLDAPGLNPEIKGVITESSKLRDQGIEIAQKQVGLATAMIGKVMTDIIKNEVVDKHKILSELADAAKTLANIHYHQTKTRTKLISPSTSEKKFLQLVAKTKRDTLLYGENLAETIKSNNHLKQSVAHIKKPVITKSVPGNKNGPPPKIMKTTGRGGPPKSQQTADHHRARQQRAYQQHQYRSERGKAIQSRYRNAQTKH